ncbi:hypothetical protein MATL_G00189450 [Megalops atlanticus]|uniref:ZBR-type domain-containing protein n=1 Tax=Megalops atlanticus TaxID=7932 RepID=A0A9D3PLN1_MEGAT|nr:hypothetical protein MATL_G00189450 [Megalops atlanticus]
MKCPFTQPETPRVLKMEHCNKVSPNQTSPRKSGACVAFKHNPPPCEKAITFDSSESVKSTHNKENHEELLDNRDFDSELILSSGGLQEDSGYLSLQSSRIENEDQDSGALKPCGKFPEGNGCVHSTPASSSKLETSPSSPKLPVLLFQRAVCKELAKGYRKTQSLDLTVINSLAGEFGLENVIGRKMGLEYVDIFEALLKKNMKHLLTKILHLLGDADLMNCKKVSKTWRKIVSNDRKAQKKCKEAEQKLRDSRRLGTLTTRDFAPSRDVFSSIQTLASTPIQRHCTLSQMCPDRSRFREFQEAASAVKTHEALKSCMRCRSPARFDPAMFRATCTRRSCGFDVCTRCHSEYHGSSSCQLGALRTPVRSKNAPIIGSAQSKRNVKRL